MNDAKEALRGEFRADIFQLRGEVRADIAVMRSENPGMREAILSRMATYQLDIISKIAELDNRITRLER